MAATRGSVGSAAQEYNGLSIVAAPVPATAVRKSLRDQFCFAFMCWMIVLPKVVDAGVVGDVLRGREKRLRSTGKKLLVAVGAKKKARIEIQPVFKSNIL